MPRYFFPASRAHHAYVMAKDHGMEFERRFGKWLPEGLLHVTGAGGYKLYVHSDSLHLLEPKQGDYVRLNGKCFGSRGRITKIAEKGCKLANGTAVWWAQPDNVEAIEQRNGKTFMMPEREA